MYTILTDSCADLNKSYFDSFPNLIVLTLEYTIGNVSNRNNPETDAESHAFYKRLRAGEVSRTSQISPEGFIEGIRPELQAGNDVLYAAFSSGLSGTYNAAMLAKQALEEEGHPGRFEVIDTLSASAGQGLLVYHVLKNREAGMSLDDNIKWLEDNKLHLAHWFTVDDLHFLKRGGRCSPAAAFFGTLVNIKPVLHVDNEGHLIAREKVRGRKSALKGLVDYMEELSINPKEQVIFISHGDCEPDAQWVAQHITKRFDIPSENIIISSIGPVIGSHSGPGTVALFFLATSRG